MTEMPLGKIIVLWHLLQFVITEIAFNVITDIKQAFLLRAVTYHKYKILQSCFTGWWRTVVAKRQRAIEFHRRCLLRQGWKALRWNMMIGKELAKMGVWHHQRWKHRRVFLKVTTFIITVDVLSYNTCNYKIFISMLTCVIL